MLVCTTWKARPLSTEQVNRMMQVWGKLEEAQATNPSVERLCWYIFGDGSGGLTVLKAIDVDAANAWGLEVTLALSEFLELESHVVLDMESAMPAILKAVERANG
jgi:hypothetical protein